MSEKRAAGNRTAVRVADEAEHEPSNLGPVLEFMRLLWAVDHGLQSASKRMHAAIGLTGPQRLVVRIVGRSPAVSAGRLAEILHVHPSTLTGVLRRLEQAGLVQRSTDSSDGRRALFTLTARGRALDRMQSGTIESRVRAALASVPASRVAAAQELLVAVAAELEEYVPAAAPARRRA